jgi:hypothetical protein
MTYQNEPNINRRNDRIDRGKTSYTGWIVGGLVALALVVGIFSMFGRDNTRNNTASNTTPATSTNNRPVAPSTTGSGVMTPAPGAPATAPAR